jgi:hypothetical protein
MDSTSGVTIARSISASEEHPYQESLPATYPALSGQRVQGLSGKSR